MAEGGKSMSALVSLPLLIKPWMLSWSPHPKAELGNFGGYIPTVAELKGETWKE
jgi:hypothetical protein